MGEVEWIGILLTAPALTMAELAWVRSPPPTEPLLAVAKMLPPLEPQIQKLKVLPEVPYNALDARGGATWLGSVPSWLNL